MRVKISALACVFLLSCSQNKKVKNDLLNGSLKGHVKLITEYCYEMRDGIKRLYCTNIYHKNMQGRTTELRRLTWGCNHCLSYNYNSKGDKTEMILVQKGVNDSGKILYEKGSATVYLHDEKGNETEEVSSNSDGIIMRTINTYDAKGNKIRDSLTYISLGKDQNELSINLWNSKVTKYNYDNLNQNTSSENYYYDSLGVIHSQGGSRYKYDSRGNMVEQIVYDGKNNIYIKTQKTYDSNNLLISTNILADSKSMTGLYTYKHDKYDMKGNPLIEATYKNDTLQTIAESKIEYY